MPRFRFLRMFWFAGVVLLVVAGCRPRPISFDDSFSASGVNPAELINRLELPEAPIEGLSARGRAQYSAPGSSDRSTIVFASDRTRTLLTLRNSLGIEGARLLVDSDSITIYNRVEQTAQRISRGRQDTMLDYSFYAVNLLSVLSPDFDSYSPRSVLENDTSWMILFADQTRMVFNKSDRRLTRIDFHTHSPFDFSTYLFANHVQVNGYWLPRNIQILSRDKKSTILLQIQSYEVNPPGLSFELDIPSNIRIER